MTQPARVQALPEASVGDGQHWGMVSTVEILVVETIAADTRRWTSIDPSHDRGAQHNIWCVARIHGCGKACNVSNDATTDDKQGLVSRQTNLFQCHENAFHITDILVGLVATEYELCELDAMCCEVCVQFLTISSIYFVVNDSHATAKWFVNIVQQIIAWI